MEIIFRMKTLQKRFSLSYSFVFPLLLCCCIKDGEKVPLFLCHSLGKFNFWSILSSLLSSNKREWVKPECSCRHLRVVFCQKLLFISHQTLKGLRRLNFPSFSKCTEKNLFSLLSIFQEGSKEFFDLKRSKKDPFVCSFSQYNKMMRMGAKVEEQFHFDM